jgi:hypothetical protein
MGKIFFICLLSFLVTSRLLAQQGPHFEQLKLKTNKDFKLADSTVSQTSNYLLAIPLNQDTVYRINAAHFLMNWMEGTNDYTFLLDENSTRAFINDTNLMATYIAAMCKSAFRYKPKVESKKITLDALKLLLAYANNSNNDVNHTDKLNELSKANDSGRLEKYLNLNSQ